MTDVELRDELMTLLTAGHETTATGLSWAFERLLRTPGVMERTLDSLDDDDYLDAVVKETLRVRPVIVDVARKLTRDTQVAGWHAARGHAGAARDRGDPHAPRPLPRARAVPAGALPRPRAPSRTRGSRSAAGCGGASGRRSRRWRCGSCCGRCCGGCGCERTSPRPERPQVRHVTVVPARGCRVVVEERLAEPVSAEATLSAA